jgi:imidazolonepropionase-like amidohydrolase
MLIINARILSMSGRDEDRGYIHFNNGKIIGIGSMDKFPQKLKSELSSAFDADGYIVMPGLVDAHTHIGILEDSIGFEGDDSNEETDPATPQLRAIDAVNPFDRSFEDAVKSGVTTIVTGPGSSNPIGGQSVAIKTTGKYIDDMIVRIPLAMKMALGENPKVLDHGKDRGPSTRMSTAALIREYLQKTIRYSSDIELAKHDEDSDEPEYDIKLDSLLPVISGDLPVHFHAHRADDIFTAIRIAREFKLKYTIVHCTDGHLIANELKSLGASALVGPSMTDRSKPELKNLTFKTAGELSKAGVLTGIITDHPETPIQYLTVCAALAVKEGMPYDDALRAITINPAMICGIDDRVGSIAPGKDADFAIFDGSPLDIFTKTTAVFVNGERVV